MGIYWYAADENEKTIMSSPGDFNNKTPGLYAKGNPFPAMVIMMNSRGCHYELVNDMETFYEECCSWKDVTEEVYADLLKECPEYASE